MGVARVAHQSLANTYRFEKINSIKDSLNFWKCFFVVFVHQVGRPIKKIHRKGEFSSNQDKINTFKILFSPSFSLKEIITMNKIQKVIAMLLIIAAVVFVAGCASVSTIK